MLPPQNQLVLPLLVAISAEGGSTSAKHACDAIASKLSLSTEDREKCTRTAGGKRYNILDRTVRWTHQIAKLRGLTENDGSGFWRLTESANDKLENARPGVVISVYENDAGVIL
jgi:restriction endonuclease Mrr